jgi:hypothetical protein
LFTVKNAIVGLVFALQHRNLALFMWRTTCTGFNQAAFRESLCGQTVRTLRECQPTDIRSARKNCNGYFRGEISMGRSVPQIFAIDVTFDGKCYSTCCSLHSGVVTLLHPEYNRWGAVVKLGQAPERMAQDLLRSRLAKMKALGELC